MWQRLLFATFSQKLWHYLSWGILGVCLKKTWELNFGHFSYMELANEDFDIFQASVKWFKMDKYFCTHNKHCTIFFSYKISLDYFCPGYANSNGIK